MPKRNNRKNKSKQEQPGTPVESPKASLPECKVPEEPKPATLPTSHSKQTTATLLDVTRDIVETQSRSGNLKPGATVLQALEMQKREAHKYEEFFASLKNTWSKAEKEADTSNGKKGDMPSFSASQVREPLKDFGIMGKLRGKTTPGNAAMNDEELIQQFRELLSSQGLASVIKRPPKVSTAPSLRDWMDTEEASKIVSRALYSEKLETPEPLVVPREKLAQYRISSANELLMKDMWQDAAELSGLPTKPPQPNPQKENDHPPDEPIEHGDALRNPQTLECFFDDEDDSDAPIHFDLSEPSKIQQYFENNDHDFYQQFGFMTATNKQTPGINFFSSHKHSSLLSDGSFEDPSYLINQLYYTDSVEAKYASVNERKNWLQEAYHECHFISKNNDRIGPKHYLLKLIEFNKIEILEKYCSTPDGEMIGIDFNSPQDRKEVQEIQVCMSRLLKQRLIRDELKHQLEEYRFEGRNCEQKALIFAIIKLCKKIINILYTKCANFTIVRQKQPYNPMEGITFTEQKSQNQTKVTEVQWKDVISEQRAYINMIQKLAETYENLTNKAKFFREKTKYIFEGVPGFKHLSEDALFKGFFFLFVYKDFILQEIISRINECLPIVKERKILAEVEKDYLNFMEADLTGWVNIMLQVEVFQSYQTIVSPNEQGSPAVASKGISTRKERKMSQLGQLSEQANFYALQKRYIISYIQAYKRVKSHFSITSQMLPENSHTSAFCIVDSDFDTEDEQYNDDIEEIISHQIIESVGCSDEEDSDDLASQVQKLPTNPFSIQPTLNKNKKRKALSGNIDKNPFKVEDAISGPTCAAHSVQKALVDFTYENRRAQILQEMKVTAENKVKEQEKIIQEERKRKQALKLAQVETENMHLKQQRTEMIKLYEELKAKHDRAMAEKKRREAAEVDDLVIDGLVEDPNDKWVPDEVEAATETEESESKRKKKNRRKKNRKKKNQAVCKCSCHATETEGIDMKAGDAPTTGDGSLEPGAGCKGKVCCKEAAAVGDCAQDEELQLRETNVAETDSDVDFEEYLRNFELRLNQESLLDLSFGAFAPTPADDNSGRKQSLAVVRQKANKSVEQITVSKKMRPNITQKWLEDIRQRSSSAS